MVTVIISGQWDYGVLLLNLLVLYHISYSTMNMEWNICFKIHIKKGLQAFRNKNTKIIKKMLCIIGNTKMGFED